jgi:hypothetical protein
MHELEQHPKLGASWEGFCIESIIGRLKARPKVTLSMQVALHDLKLDSLDVIHAGRDTFRLAKNIRAVSLHRLEDIAGG